MALTGMPVIGGSLAVDFPGVFVFVSCFARIEGDVVGVAAEVEVYLFAGFIDIAAVGSHPERNVFQHSPQEVRHNRRAVINVMIRFFFIVSVIKSFTIRDFV